MMLDVVIYSHVHQTKIWFGSKTKKIGHSETFDKKGKVSIEF